MRTQSELIVGIHRMRVRSLVRRRHVLGMNSPTHGVADVLVRQPAKGVGELGELVGVFEA